MIERPLNGSVDDETRDRAGADAKPQRQHPVRVVSNFSQLEGRGNQQAEEENSEVVEEAPSPGEPEKRQEEEEPATDAEDEADDESQARALAQDYRSGNAADFFSRLAQPAAVSIL